MNERLSQYIEAKKCNNRDAYEQRKRAFLIKEGLVEKEYGPYPTYSEDYPEFEYDETIKAYRYFKLAPMAVSDEEYEELLKLNNVEDEEHNKVSVALLVTAIIIFGLGFVFGIVFGVVPVEKGFYYSYPDTEFSFAVAFTYWAAAFIGGMLFLGLSEIVKLLHKQNKLKNK